MTQISFLIMVKNGALTLDKTLQALKNWPHVVIFDTGSTDGTLDLLKNYPHVKLFCGEFKGFGPTRNLATKFVTTPWVFHLDADEVPTRCLLEELKTLSCDPHKVYSVKRDNYFWGKCMKGCSGWSNDYVNRLYHTQFYSYSLDLVHEKVLCKKSDVLVLKNPLNHTPYPNLKSMIDKMNHYSDLFVKNTKKKPSAIAPYFHSLFAFFKSYILKKGITQGYRGLVLSKYIADTAFYKYLKLYESQIK